MKRRVRSRVHLILEGHWHELRRPERLVRGALLLAILTAVATALVEDAITLRAPHRLLVGAIELVVTVLFAFEYALRLWSCVEDRRYADPLWGRLRYALRIAALIDLVAVLPGLLWLLGLDLRVLRFLRILRILKLTRLSGSLDLLADALRAEADALLATFSLALVALVLAAAGMHWFEAERQPDAFGSVLSAMWWAVATLTTVGYGDVTPVTPGGRFFGGIVSLIGVGLVSLPAAILAAGFGEQLRLRRETYRRMVERAYADGRLTRRERAELEAARQALALPPETAEESLAEVTEERRARNGRSAPGGP